MPSSLIFVGLVVAWLLILVPIVARRRQEVARPSEAALACRVLDRPTVSRSAEEVSEMDEPAQDRQLVEDVGDEQPAEPMQQAADHSAPELTDVLADLDLEPEPEPEPEPLAESEPAERPRSPGYRSGRGGFDPEAATLAARVRSSFRQRMVLALLLAAMATAAGAFIADETLWWGHAGVDVFLVGYLVYLRRQVRIEEEIRQRRAARMAGTRSARTVAEYVAAQRADGSPGGREPAQDSAELTVEDPALPELEPLEPEHREHELEPDQPALPPLRPSPLPRAPRGTAVIDIDDEDPGLHQLADPGQAGYRRAAGQ